MEKDLENFKKFLRAFGDLIESTYSDSRKIDYSTYNEQNSTNYDICKSCGGICCKQCGCHFSPRDFKELSFDYLKSEKKHYPRLGNAFFIFSKSLYSVLNALTGSFFAAIFAGIHPPIKVSITLINTNKTACIGFKLATFSKSVIFFKTLFIGIFVLLLASGIIIWQRQRLRIRQTENDALIAEASSLKESMTDRDSKLASLLANRFTLLDELCGTYYESQGTRTERKAIAEKVRLQIETLQKNDKMFAQIEGTINDCRNNLLMKLKEAIPTLKPEEYRLYALLACGFSNRTIALLLDESIDVVYKRKSRLKAKVSETHEAEFLTVF